MKRFCLYFRDLKNIHLTKDVGYIPAFLEKFYTCEIATKTKDTSFPDLKINSIKIVTVKNFFFYAWKTRPERIMFFHINRKTFFNVFLMRLLPYKKKIYVKADYGLCQVEKIKKKRKFKKYLHFMKINFLLRLIDLLSFEDKEIFAFMSKNLCCKNRILHIPNGFSLKKQLPSVNEKKQMLTVSNLSQPRKRTLQLLKLLIALKSDLRGWKMLFVGNYKEIQSEVEQIIRENNVDSLVKFTGQIYNREKLYKLFLESKIFLFNSNEEGFPNVFSEAGYFHNVLISTNVGGAREITQEGKHGGLCAVDDPSTMKKAILSYVNNPSKLKKDQDETKRTILKNHSWETLVKKIYMFLR